MCLIALAYKTSPDITLAVSANRDEFYQRPTEALHWWPEGILAGKDQLAGGTWLGVSKAGRFAALTNVREPQVKPGSASRGELVRNFLADQQISAQQYAESLRAHDHNYSGYNLLIFDGEQLVYTSNRSTIQFLEAGIYGLSNSLLDTPWPKTCYAKQQLANLQPSNLTSDTLATLLTRTAAFNAPLPNTGIPLQWEQALSVPFIVTPEYGTRCSTGLLISQATQHVEVKEITYTRESATTVKVKQFSTITNY